MACNPNKAFILAAGLGTRLRPYTDTIPKPMIDVAGRSIIRRAIEKLHESGANKIVVNLHHLAPILRAHLEDISAPEIIFSEEETLLDTGGGIKQACDILEATEPLFILNGDALWEDADTPALARLAAAWDDSKMDILLLLQPLNGMNLTHGVGDYRINHDGKAVRAKNRDGDHMFAGIRIAHPRIFENTPQGAFSFLELMDRAEQNGRLYALPHNGAWHHISTPEEYHAVDASYKERGIA